MNAWSWVWDRGLETEHTSLWGTNAFLNQVQYWFPQDLSQGNIPWKKPLESREVDNLGYFTHLASTCVQGEIKWSILIYCHCSTPFVSWTKCSNPDMGTQFIGIVSTDHSALCVQWNEPHPVHRGKNESLTIHLEVHGCCWYDFFTSVIGS